MPMTLTSLRPASDLNSTSIESYNRAWNTLKERGVDTLNLEAIKKYFKEYEYKIASQRFILSTIIHYYRDKPEHAEYLNTLRKYNLSLRPILEKQKEAQVMSAEQKKKHVPWDEVVDKSMKYINNEKNRLDHRILVGMYSLLDPVRCDYTNMKMYRRTPKDVCGSYFLINKKKQEVVITEYKTSKKHGNINQCLPELLTNLIEQWFKDNKDGVLFDMSENYMSRVVKKLFTEVTGKPMTITALRHSRITFHLSDSPPPLVNKILARNMGHTVGIQQSYRFVSDEKTLSFT
jgi:integrase